MANKVRQEIASALQAQGIRPLEIAEVRSGTRGFSAAARYLGPEGEAVRAFVKLNREDEPCFRRELAAVRLMSGIVDRLPVPHFLLAHEPSRLIAWEELQGLCPLSEMLAGNDCELAEESLAFLAWALAALHLRTASLVAEADVSLRGRASEEAQALREGTERIAGLISTLGEPVPHDLDKAVASVADEHERGGEAGGGLVALTHGDMAPSNVLCGAECVWLVDFEYAAFRPMLYDLATWTTICPLPENYVDVMLALYRARIAEEIPMVLTEAFERSWASTCAFRALSMITWFGAEVVEENGPWGGDWDRRSALATALRRAADAAEEGEGLVEMRELLDLLAEATERAWEVRPLRFPALEIGRGFDLF